MRPRVLKSALAASLLTGCSMVGPDFTTPEAKLNPSWLGSGESRIAAEPTENGQWWLAFKDPALTRLVDLAYTQNL